MNSSSRARLPTEKPRRASCWSSPTHSSPSRTAGSRLELHKSGTCVRFTEAGAALFA